MDHLAPTRRASYRNRSASVQTGSWRQPYYPIARHWALFIKLDMNEFIHQLFAGAFNVVFMKIQLVRKSVCILHELLRPCVKLYMRTFASVNLK